MVSKNNYQFYQQKHADGKQRWGVRKLSVGVASVLLGTTFMLHSNHAVLADTVTNSSDVTRSTTTQEGNKDKVTEGTTEGTTSTPQTSGDSTATEKGQGKTLTETPTDTDKQANNQKVNQQVPTTDTEENVVATNHQGTPQGQGPTQDKDKQTNANETTQNATNVGKKDTEVTPANDATTPTTPTTQNTTNVDKKDTEVTPTNDPKTPATQVKFKVRAAQPVKKEAPTAETPDPTVPDKSANTAIINNQDELANDWMQLEQGKLKIYLTLRGLDNKIYVSSYADAQKKIKSMIISNRLDPNSLEVHVDFENTDVKKNIATMFGWNTKVMQIDTSRLGTDGIVAYGKSGKKYQIGLNHDGGNYDYYPRMVELHKDISQVGALYMTDPIEANDTISTTIPVKYIGNKEQTTSIFLTSYFKKHKSYPGLELDFRELHPAQIETPAKPTTDKDTVTTGIYNNPRITTSDWIKMVHGKAIAYYTAKGKDGKTYVTGYVAANGKSQSIINVNQIDLNTLEYHLIYHNGDKEVGSGLWFNFADNKAIAIDTSRLGADGPQLKSQQGWSYKWAINGPKDGGNYYNSWAEYLKAHNGKGDQATNISMTGTVIKPDDMVEFVIPVKYTGQLTARTPSLTFSPRITDYGKGITYNWVDLYFTTVKKDLSEVKRVVLLPTEFMGEQAGESDWKLVKEISKKDMPNGWDAFKISNFPTYKGSFNMDSLPKGDLPSLVYGSAQYFIDLSKIQEIFANHGYTVKYANNNGKAQEMPFYAYSTIPLAKRVDDDKPFNNDPSIWVIHVQAVPAIILNKDQHYVADPNAKPWDTTSMIDAIYAADDAGARKTRDQLEKLPKTAVDISYEYQAPGAATATAVDKVDLTKAGVYTVTYSHTYADGQVVKDSRKVYVDGVKKETKDITRTIIVHKPNESDQKVIQTATLTRDVILDATTGEIKSLGDWSTTNWGTYSAPEVKGYTPSLAQIDEIAVNKDTQDTTVEISYKANEITKPETKDITRTIIVHTPNGTDQTVIQKATLTRDVILYEPTGKIKSVGEWSPAKWGEYSAPEFQGYTPDPAHIDETAVNKDTQDTTVEISYKANEITKPETKDITRTIIVHAPNGTDQKVIQTATLTRDVILYEPTGKIKSVGDWSPAKWERYLAPEFKGYTPAPAQIDETAVNEDTQDTTVEISYTANKTPEQPDHNGKQETKDITRTIIVHTPNGTDQTVIQKATVTRKVILDATTGEIKSAGKWSTAKWERYLAPEFQGYTPSPAQIDATTVNEDTQDTTVEISYTANKTPEQPDHNGKQETKDITRTIIVHTPNGTDQTVIQKATVTRKVILDATTGEIKSAGKWSTAKWERYSAPEFKGYTPAPAQIDETTVNEDTQDTTIEISYTANKTPEQPDHNGKQETKDITRTIIVHTPNGTDQTVIQKATLTRKVVLDATTGEIKSAGKWSTAKWGRYSAPEFKGYTPAPAQIDETTVNEDTQDTTVEISYTANKTPEQPDHNGKQETKDITRTIIVHTPNGTDQTVIQKATVTRKVVLDATTGEIKSAGKWSTAKWERYSAPEFKGYTPSPAQIDETTVNEDTQDTTVEISYTANKTPEQPDHNGKQETKDITRTIIVHMPNGTDQTVIQKATVTRKVVLDATTGQIKSAGKWSTAKWGRYSAPEFKGYTPAPAQIDETTVNEDTQDTTVEISYTANKTPDQPTVPSKPATPEEPAQPEQPSEPTTPETPVEPSTPDQPTVPSKPATPEEPAQPEQPSEPTTPETPVEPSTPDQPTVPSKPATPAEPKTTEKTNTPASPVATASQTSQKTSPSKKMTAAKLPQTGGDDKQSSEMTLMGAILLALSAATGFVTGKKRKKD